MPTPTTARVSTENTSSQSMLRKLRRSSNLFRLLSAIQLLEEFEHDPLGDGCRRFPAVTAPLHEDGERDPCVRPRREPDEPCVVPDRFGQFLALDPRRGFHHLRGPCL